MAQVAEYLLSKHKALSLNPSTTTKTNRQKKYIKLLKDHCNVPNVYTIFFTLTNYYEMNTLFHVNEHLTFKQNVYVTKCT
jgi:hypothetical protein